MLRIRRLTPVLVVALTLLRFGPGPLEAEILRGDALLAPRRVVEHFRVATWNVWGLPSSITGACDSRYEAIAERVRVCDLDVVALQEVWTAEARAALPGDGSWNVVRERDADLPWVGSCGLVTLSRLPVRRAAVRRFRESVGWDALVSKGALFCELERPGHPPIQVWNVHLQSGEGADVVAARRLQLAELARWVELERRDGAPVLVLGDFNCAASDGQCETEMAWLGEDLARRPGAAELPLCTWDPVRNPWAREAWPMAIDRIVLDAGGCVRTRSAVELAFHEPCWKGRPLSDHYGLRAEIVFQAPRGSGGLALERGD